jgi:hypothetical protein
MSAGKVNNMKIKPGFKMGDVFLMFADDCG